MLIYVFAGKYLLYLFMDDVNGEAMRTGIQFLRIVAPFYFIASIKLATDGFLRGAGMMKQFMAATFTDLILRVVLAIVFAKMFGSIGIWCAWPIGWSIGTGVSTVFYHYGPWREKKDGA